MCITQQQDQAIQFILLKAQMPESRIVHKKTILRTNNLFAKTTTIAVKQITTSFWLICILWPRLWIRETAAFTPERSILSISLSPYLSRTSLRNRQQFFFHKRPWSRAFTQLFHVPVRSFSSSRRSRDDQQQLSQQITTPIADSERLPEIVTRRLALLANPGGSGEVAQLTTSRRRRRRRTGSESSCCEDGKPLVINSSVDVGVTVHWAQVSVPC